MGSFQEDQNCQFFLVLTESVGALMISLIDRAKKEGLLMQESFRRAVLPAHRVIADFLGFPPCENQLSQSFQMRDVHQNPFRTLPSLHHNFFPRSSQPTEVNGCQVQNITPLPNISMPPSTPLQGWRNTPLGFTSTPFRTPAVRPRPEQFALINQLLTAMRTSEDSLESVTDQFVNDPIFRERMLGELDELRTLIIANPHQGTSIATSQTIDTLLNRVDQAEITLSSLIQNLQQLQNITMPQAENETEM